MSRSNTLLEGMHSCSVYRPVLNAEQAKLDELAAEVASAGIKGLQWAAAASMRCTLVDAKEIAHEYRAIGRIISLDEVEDLADWIDRSLPDKEETDPLIIPSLPLNVHIARGKGNARTIMMGTGDPTMGEERKIIQSTVNTRLGRPGEWPKNAGFMIGVPLVRGRPTAIEKALNFLMGSEITSTLLPKTLKLQHVIIEELLPAAF